MTDPRPSLPLNAGDVVDVNPGEPATIIDYTDHHPGGNGFRPHGRVFFTWRDGERCISQVADYGPDGLMFGPSHFFPPGEEELAEATWAGLTARWSPLS